MQNVYLPNWKLSKRISKIGSVPIAPKKPSSRIRQKVDMRKHDLKRKHENKAWLKSLFKAQDVMDGQFEINVIKAWLKRDLKWDENVNESSRQRQSMIKTWFPTQMKPATP